METDWCYTLAGSIIKQAVDDLWLVQNNPAVARDAYEFLTGNRLDELCEKMGVSADYIRRKIDFSVYTERLGAI